MSPSKKTLKIVSLQKFTTNSVEKLVLSFNSKNHKLKVIVRRCNKVARSNFGRMFLEIQKGWKTVVLLSVLSKV